MLDEHHLHKLQLCLILCFAQTALQRLIAFLSLEHSPNPNNCPNTSLKKIVENHNKNNPKNKVPNSEIKELDITAAKKILRTIKEFLTSNSYREGSVCCQTQCSSQDGICNYCLLYTSPSPRDS